MRPMRRVQRILLAWLSAAAVVGALSAPASVAADTFSTWTPGPGAAGDNTYTGYIDVPPANATVPGDGNAITWAIRVSSALRSSCISASRLLTNLTDGSPLQTARAGC